MNYVREIEEVSYGQYDPVLTDYLGKPSYQPPVGFYSRYPYQLVLGNQNIYYCGSGEAVQSLLSNYDMSSIDYYLYQYQLQEAKIIGTSGIRVAVYNKKPITLEEMFRTETSIKELNTEGNLKSVCTIRSTNIVLPYEVDNDNRYRVYHSRSHILNWSEEEFLRRYFL